MSDDVRRRKPAAPKSGSTKTGSSATRITWARSLSNIQFDALLQDALLKTRASNPRTHDVVILEELVHELKSRLSRYTEIMGELPKEDEDEDS